MKILTLEFIMDCVRTSTHETDGYGAYIAKYVLNAALTGKGEDACREVCLSDQKCKVWKYVSSNTQDNCYTSDYLISDTIDPLSTAGTFSGIIECKKQYNLLNILLYIFIVAIILLVVCWYILFFKGTKISIH